MIRNIIYPSGKYHKKYINFVGWSFVSNIVVSLESVLSTHSMLSTVGTFGNEYNVSLNYVGKDIIGQIGGLAIIHKIGKMIDKNPKKFNIYSMGFQQSALFIECATPLFNTEQFLYIAGSANLIKNISFTGFGAINAKCIEKLAKSDNIGEIYAKISITNTIGSTIGMCAGLFIAGLVPDHEMRLCFIPILGALRFYSFNKALQGLV